LLRHPYYYLGILHVSHHFAPWDSVHPCRQSVELPAKCFNVEAAAAFFCCFLLLLLIGLWLLLLIAAAAYSSGCCCRCLLPLLLFAAAAFCWFCVCVPAS
jgi:hypothetical protein